MRDDLLKYQNYILRNEGESQAQTKYIQKYLQINKYIYLYMIARNIILTIVVLLATTSCSDSRQVYVEFGSGVEAFQIDKFVAGIEDGFYVDIGGYDPLFHSNTYALYLKGWKGIVAEPNPYKMQNFNVERLNEVHLNIAVGNEDQYLSLFQAPDDSTATVSLAVKQSKQVYKKFNKIIKVPSMTLSQLCHRYFIKTPIFMNLDAEGYGGQILTSNDWSDPLCIPDMIMAESNQMNVLSGLPIPQKLLIQKGYIRFHPDKDLYIRKDVHQKYMDKKKKSEQKLNYENYNIIFFSQITPIIKKELNIITLTIPHYQRKNDPINYYFIVNNEPLYLEKVNQRNNWYSNISQKLIVVIGFNPLKNFIVLSHNNYTVADVQLKQKQLRFQNITVYGEKTFSALIFDHRVSPRVQNKIMIIKPEYPFYQCQSAPSPSAIPAPVLAPAPPAINHKELATEMSQIAGQSFQGISSSLQKNIFNKMKQQIQRLSVRMQIGESQMKQLQASLQTIKKIDVERLIQRSEERVRDKLDQIYMKDKLERQQNSEKLSNISSILLITTINSILIVMLVVTLCILSIKSKVKSAGYLRYAGSGNESTSVND